MNSEIFREYDIRGIADRDLTDEVTEKLGRSIATIMKREACQKVAVGRDVRLSSLRLRNHLIDGLLAGGLSVVDIGQCPTPYLYFALHRLDVGGGVMITGSHNPADYNGFKVAIGKSTLHGEQIQEIRDIAEKADFTEGEGELFFASVAEDYLEYFGESFDNLAGVPRVVVDCGNGTASLVAVEAYERIGADVIPLFCEVDGTFPNHHPDPTVEEYLQDLIAKVEAENADLGIAFDGDADRIGVVDASGRIIWGDELLILYSREILRERPGATIVAEVKCSMNLYDDIKAKGGRAIMWKAGHSLIKAKMAEESAVLAGEMSGHMFFADRYFGFDDAIYAGARLLEVCARTGQSPAQLLADLPRLENTPEIRVETPDKHKFEIVKRAQEFFSQNYEAVTVDGVRVIFDDGWGLVRASNTQPALVLRFEANSKERLQEIRELMESKLNEIRSEVEKKDAS